MATSTETNQQTALVAACRSALVRMGTEDRFASVSMMATDTSAADQQASKGLLKSYEDFKKNLQIEVGTLLKLDNVSLLLAAGCSMEMGGVGFGSIPHIIERRLLDEGQTNEGTAPWLSLFYAAVQAAASTEQGQQSGIRKQHLESLGENPLDIARRAAELEDKPLPNELEGDLGDEECHKHLLPINFERFLTALYGWDAALRSGVTHLLLEDQLSVDGELLTQLINRLKSGLVDACTLPKDEVTPRTHATLLRKLMTRPEKLRRVNLFTLNYDTLLEQAADAAGVILLDGFVGSIRRVFRPESFGFDFYFPGSTTEGRVHRLDRVAHLYKLHGSISWYRESPTEQNPYGIFSTANSSSQGDVLIFPTPVKQELATGIPYSEMFRRFSEAVSQPQSVLFVIGYGFGDDHVNALIRQALLVPSFRLVVVSPSGQSEFLSKLIKCEDPRIWVISGWPEQTDEEGLFGFGSFEAFVENVLPDLQDEYVRKDMSNTYRALAQTTEKDEQDE
ncbi:SIR2 family protein [Candidatus Bipolaricaulota bacterium]